MSLSDRDLIYNHLARYCFVVDRDDADAIADLFWEDAELEFGGRHSGREAIRRCYDEWIQTKRNPVVGLRHMIYLPLIELEGDEARTETYVDADAHTRRSGQPQVVATCGKHDQIKVSDGRGRCILAFEHK